MSMRTQNGKWFIKTKEGHEVTFTNSRDAWEYVFFKASQKGGQK